jgi:uncharacterized protein YbbK (DUF523 family)
VVNAKTALDILMRGGIGMSNMPKLGVSACLLGEKVRYNGDGAEFRSLTRAWSHHLDLIGVCPEVGIGMGTPRPTIRLVNRDGKIHLVNPKTDDDFTQDMLEYAELQSDALMKAEICGFVFKKDSPSCGLERVRVYRDDQPQAIRNGTGLFALVFTTLNPHIPVIEEGRLSDPLQAEHFLGASGILFTLAGRRTWWMDCRQTHAFPQHQQIVLAQPFTKGKAGTWAASRPRL